jgi:DDE family transposase
MEHARFDSAEWPALVLRLGGAEALAASAREHAAFQRARGVKSATDVLRLALMYGPGGLPLRVLAAAAAEMGIADVSDVALLNRIRGAADRLEALCGEALARAARIHATTRPDRPISIIDGSRINGPGAAAWRLHLCYDPHGGRVLAAAITTTREGERLDRLPVTAGEIRLGDRGFPQPNGLKNTREAEADVLVRVTWNSLRLTDSDDCPLDWLELCATASAQGSVDLPVRVHKAHGRFAPLDLRLVILPKPPLAAAQARVQARRENRKGGRRRLDPRTLAAADHLILLTSLTPEAFSAARLAALYRVRWQIELAFKRMKSLLHIDRLPAKDPALARAWLHAHLLVALLAEATIEEIEALPP